MRSDADRTQTAPGVGRDPLIAWAPVFGKKWHLVVIHRLSTRGPMGFNALARSIDGLHHKVLADCLDDLRGRGLVAREVVSESPRRVRYSLTPAGETLQPVLRAMERWGEEAVERAETPEQGVVTVP